jgi:L-iditol 2-dehydrogenase
MKAAVCKKPFEIVIEEAPIPVPGPDELLVQVKASAICGSDIKGYDGKHPLIRLPLILGHEFSGVIAGKGSAVEGFCIGDRVVVEPSSVCGSCFFCRRKEYALCTNLKQLGHQLPGSFAEYTLSKAQFTYPLPETIAFDKAALVQPLAISIHAADRTSVRQGQTVIILGMGPIGLLLLQVMKKRGARILVSDLVDDKLNKAISLGADQVCHGADPAIDKKIKDWTEGRGADIVIEAAGTSATIDQSFSFVRRGGTILLLGITGHEREEVPLEKVVLDELNLLGTVRYGAEDFPRAIEMIQNQAIDLEALLTQRFKMSDLPRVFRETALSPGKTLRSVMVA